MNGNHTALRYFGNPRLVLSEYITKLLTKIGNICNASNPRKFHRVDGPNVKSRRIRVHDYKLELSIERCDRSSSIDDSRDFVYLPNRSTNL